MELNITFSGTKAYLNWTQINADLYIIYLKKDGVFIEYAKTYHDAFTTLSLLPFGQNEIFVRAFKNGVKVDESEIKSFIFPTLDVVCTQENNAHEMRILYSSFPEAQGYRLYRNESGGFNGFKNSTTQSIVIKAEDQRDSYKIKPYNIVNNARENLCSSQVFTNPTTNFKHITLYKSYNNNMFLSWIFEGYADGFIVYSQYSEFPVFETGDGKCHCTTLKGFKNDTKFKICAFINSSDGKVIINTSDYVELTEREYSHPEVSLIIPAYNAKDYIARSIDSALASNFNDLEIIIVNDGSTDSTQDIMEWYASNYKNVIIKTKENGGVADTRNMGIQLANGRYIAFLDNDDMIRPNMISSLYTSITKNNCQIAIAPLYRLVDSGYTIHCDLPFEQDKAIDVDDYFEIMYTPGYYNCAIWNKLYDAQMVKTHPLGILKYEDVSWTPCIISWAEKFCFIKTPYYEWDRKTRPETFGNVLAKMPDEELFEHRKQAMMFFVENGNPKRKESLKTVARRRLNRYANQKTTLKNLYLNLIEELS